MTDVERHPAADGDQTATSRAAEPVTAGDAEPDTPAGTGPVTVADTGRAGPRKWRRRTRKIVVAVAMTAAVVVVMAAGWTRIESSGRLHVADAAPRAPVVVVFGAQLAPGGTEPMPFLAGRLEVAADLVRTGRARVVLVSGDARGTSGNEISAMTAYLHRRGVPTGSVVGDPYGLDSYNTCARAARVYGVRRALLVTQGYHLPRTVMLCRRVGIDAHGVRARCDGCRTVTLVANTARESLASVKALADAVRRPPPLIDSPPDPAIANALRN
jgi:vancomycin permeability regulator SanA